MPLDFDKYAQDGNRFIKSLAENLEHPDETGRTGIVLRAVLHTLRERITISESMNLLSQLPMFLKALYVENWKYREKPLPIDNKVEFLATVKKHQEQYGESEFNWTLSTEEIFKTVMYTLGEYVSEGEMENIVAQLPKELKGLVSEPTA